MDDLFSKYKDALHQNESLSILLKKQETKIKLLEEELNYLRLSTNNQNQCTKDDQENIPNDQLKKEAKKEVTEMERKIKQQEQNFREFFVENRKYVVGLLGYQMEINEDHVNLLSLYAFDKSDMFCFQKCDDSLELMSNEFAEGYGKEINEYIMVGKSIPAFLAAVTLDLWNKKTFQ